MKGHTAVSMQKPPKPNAILHIGRGIEAKIAAQRRDLLCGRDPHPCPLEHDLSGIPRRELRENEREEADAKEHGYAPHDAPQDITSQSIHLHATSASDTP